MDIFNINLRGIRRERAADRARRNTGKVKLSAADSYAAAQKRKAKEPKHPHVAKDTWL